MSASINRVFGAPGISPATHSDDFNDISQRISKQWDLYMPPSPKHSISTSLLRKIELWQNEIIPPSVDDFDSISERNLCNPYHLDLPAIAEIPEDRRAIRAALRQFYANPEEILERFFTEDRARLLLNKLKSIPWHFAQPKQIYEFSNLLRQIISQPYECMEKKFARKCEKKLTELGCQALCDLLFSIHANEPVCCAFILIAHLEHLGLQDFDSYLERSPELIEICDQILYPHKYPVSSSSEDDDLVETGF